MTEPIDEYAVQQITEYEGKKLVSVTKEGLELPEDEEEKKLFEETKKSYESTVSVMKEILGDKVEKIIISNRLTDSPCCVVSGQFGWSANMERIMKAQALGDNTMSSYMMSKKNLEINPHHPIIKDLKEKLGNEETKNIAGNLLQLLFETSCINSGYSLSDPTVFTGRIYNMVKLGLGLDDSENSDVSNQVVDTETGNIDISGLTSQEDKEEVLGNTTDEQMEEVD